MTHLCPTFAMSGWFNFEPGGWYKCPHGLKISHKFLDYADKLSVGDFEELKKKHDMIVEQLNKEPYISDGLDPYEKINQLLYVMQHENLDRTKFIVDISYDEWFKLNATMNEKGYYMQQEITHDGHVYPVLFGLKLRKVN